MENEITSNLIMEIGKDMYDAMLSGLSHDDYIEKFGAQEILSKFKPEEILSIYAPEERLSGLKLEDIEAYLRKNQKRHD